MATTLKPVHPSHNNEAIDSADNLPTVPAVQSRTERPIWEIIVEIGSQIPDEEWAKVSDDASINYKHYLYGVPKKSV